MTIRLFGALLCGAALLLATQTDLAQGQSRATNQALGGNFKSKNVKPLAERGSPRQSPRNHRQEQQVQHQRPLNK